jgi:hypothetical protein
VGSFFHISVAGTVLTNAEILDVQSALEHAPDWYRYANNNWIVYAHESLDYWRDRFRATNTLRGDRPFFVCAFTEYSGYMQPVVWQWMKKPRF